MKPAMAFKLYWRPAGGGWHCFERGARGEMQYVSLCGRNGLYRVGGQSVLRPPPLERCARCDGEEMAIRGWSESGPTAPDFGRAAGERAS